MRVRFLRLAALLILSALIRQPVVWPATQPRSVPLGIIVQSNDEKGAVDSKLEGATVCDADRLSTPLGKGAKRIRIGNSQIVLKQDSAVDLNGFPNEFSVSLRRGTLKLSTSQGQRFRIYANGLAIQPANKEPASVEVAVLSLTEITLISEIGSLVVSMEEETKTIEPGSYRIDLLPSGVRDSADPAFRPLSPGRSYFTITVIVLASIGTGIAIWRSLVSPCKP